MIDYRKDICDDCDDDELKTIVKRLPGRKLCNLCNKARLDEVRAEREAKYGKSRASRAKPKSKNTGQWDLFNEIWLEREHVSVLSGESLEQFYGTDLWVNCFAHVLSKAKNQFPQYILYKPNIQLLTPQEHFLFDQGYAEQREKYANDRNCNWEKLYAFKESLKEQYPDVTYDLSY